MSILREIRNSELAIYIFPALSIVFVLLVSLNVLFPQIGQIVDKRSDLVKKKSLLSEARKKRLQLEAITADATLENLEQAEIALPQEKDPASVIIYFENVAAQTQVALSDIGLTPGLVSTGSAGAQVPDTGSTLEKHGAQILGLKIGTLSTYAQQLGVIDTLYNSRRVFDIERITFEFDPTQTDFVSANWSLHTYYQPPITSLTEIDAPLPALTSEETRAIAELSGMPILSQLVTQTVAGPVGKSNLFIRE